MTTERAIELIHVRKAFGDVVAVDDVDLAIGDGEFFSLLGPSGSGKTTVLRMIAGFEEPTAGAILLGGRDVTHVPPYDRDVNTVFQDYALFPHMSVQQNVEYGLMVKGVAKNERRRRAGEMLETMRLDGYGNRRPTQMSGGQRQRVALARALVNRPSLLLLDEPLGALDLKLREEMQVELKRIQHEVGITFVFVTHDQGEALSMSTRVAVFNLGRIEQVGEPRDIYDHPSSEFVAGFVGTSNLLDDDLSVRMCGVRSPHTLRPERVRLVTGSTPLGADERGAFGRVVDIQYLGPISRVRVSLDQGGALVASVPSDGLAGMGDGDEVQLGWHASAVMSVARSNELISRRGSTMISSARPRRRLLAGAAVAALILAACGDDDDDAGGAATEAPASATTAAPAEETAPETVPAMAEDTAEDTAAAATTAPAASASGEVPEGAPTELGEGEGEVNLIAWAGYVEDGSTDPAVDWVTDFEERTGCSVNVTLGNTSDEMVSLMQTGEYDGVSASGDATQRLIVGGEVSPVNVDLIPNYADVYDDLKLQKHNSVDGVPYGVPHGRGANLLVFNTDTYPTAPDSWGEMFDANSAGAGSVSVYDAPIYIADAAVYLMATQPELGIQNPYALTQEQFDAAIALLEEQKDITGQYWSLYTDQQAALEGGTALVGTTWQVIVNLAQANGAKIDAVKPKEGATGWSDTWMISSKAEHPNCMYMWMDHIISPEANAAVAEWFGEAPSNQNSCDLTTDPNHCAIFHAGETEYWKDVWYWTTPTEECVDGSGSDCVGFSDWVEAWNALRA